MASKIIKSLMEVVVFFVFFLFFCFFLVVVGRGKEAHVLVFVKP